jgi:hypothetical protein
LLGLAAIYNPEPELPAEGGAAAAPPLGGGPDPAAPEGLKVALGAVLAGLANNGPVGPGGQSARSLASAALEILG